MLPLKLSAYWNETETKQLKSRFEGVLFHFHFDVRTLYLSGNLDDVYVVHQQQGEGGKLPLPSILLLL